MGFWSFKKCNSTLVKNPNNPHRNFLNDAFFGLKTRVQALSRRWSPVSMDSNDQAFQLLIRSTPFR
ncbi:hypothetical protein OIU84_030138 [Salix udensis]|uniref:Uncharacterized protein n=1 Tax=Salix udensis TaxID=889485 RepID=A0AAD6KB30_9ROSI|nr:hypothetical protein OIU84_030138 [Salix udensis]